MPLSKALILQLLQQSCSVAERMRLIKQSEVLVLLFLCLQRLVQDAAVNVFRSKVAPQKQQHKNVMNEENS